MPLTEDQKTIIKATVPILQTGGETLTKHFYGVMLKEYPEVVPFFNMSHQRTGDQPRALAHAVLMYAKHIDNLEAIGPLAGQIINKHVALAVRADHYPIVGACLLRSIREVLGPEVATDAVLDAWGAAYTQLADILIAAEEAAFKKNEEAHGGWRNAREFEVSHREAESSEIVSFYLSPTDKGDVLAYLPGQYIAVQVNVDGADVRRTYSLSQVSNGKEYRISVKKEDGGAVSNFLHNLPVGAKVKLLPPAGQFHYEESDKDLVLIGGGVGITPLLPILEHAVENTSRKVTFIHYARNEKAQAFAKQIAALAAHNPDRLTVHNHFSDVAKNHLSAEELRSWMPAHTDVDVYFVGPKPFMAEVRRDLLAFGVPESQLKFEFFGPAAQLA